MLEQIALDEILFLDIETVSQSPEFGHLDDDFKTLWTEKSRFMREKSNTSIEDSYESAGIYAEFGKVICVSAGYFASRQGERIFRVTSFYGDDEEVVLQDFAAMLNQHTGNKFKILCAHNGKEFDFPYLCRRMIVNNVTLPVLLDIAGKKPWEIGHLDTMELWKFGDYKHYTSLKLLAKILGVPTPKDDIDGSQVKAVYYNEKDLGRIERYCKKDVVTVAQILLRYRGEKILQEENIVAV